MDVDVDGRAGRVETIVGGRVVFRNAYDARMRMGRGGSFERGSSDVVR